MPDRSSDSFWRSLFKFGTAPCAVLCGVLGILAAVSALTLGFWKTLLLAACFGVGCFIGLVPDKAAFFRKLIARVIRRESE
jgi:uncharacterized membrane protein